MPWFRISSFLFACWALLFAGFPHWTNSLAAVNYVPSKHADDWTLLFGLSCLGFAVLLDQAHRSANDVARRVVARGVVALTLPCVLIMSYWQFIPDRRWTRFDIGNISLLILITCVMLAASRVRKPGTSDE
jgi:cytochrome bd-type quinol oxidase subunit 2